MIASCSEKRNSAADFYFRHSVCQQRSYNQLRSFSRVKEETILLQDCFVNDAHNENIGQPALELRSIIDLGISLTRLRSLKLGGWITRSFDSRALLLDTRAKCWGLLFFTSLVVFLSICATQWWIWPTFTGTSLEGFTLVD